MTNKTEIAKLREYIRNKNSTLELRALAGTILHQLEAAEARIAELEAKEIMFSFDEYVAMLSESNASLQAEIAALREAAVPVYQILIYGNWTDTDAGEYTAAREDERRVLFTTTQPAPVLVLPNDVPDLINLSIEQQTEFNRGFWFGIEKVKRLNSEANFKSADGEGE